MTLKFLNKFEIQPGKGGGGSTLITKTITANGTYNASSDNADGYSQVIVNVAPPELESYITQVGGTFLGVKYTSDANCYLYNNAQFDIAGADTWEFGTILKYNGGGGSSRFIIGRMNSTSNLYTPVLFVSTGNQLMWFVSSTNSSWDILEGGSEPLLSNITTGKTYEIIVGFDGTKYYAKVGVDGATPSTVKEITSSSKVYSTGYFMFMNDYSEGIYQCYNSGEMNLNETYFKIDDTTYKFINF